METGSNDKNNSVQSKLKDDALDAKIFPANCVRFRQVRRDHPNGIVKLSTMQLTKTVHLNSANLSIGVCFHHILLTAACGSDKFFSFIFDASLLAFCYVMMVFNATANLKYN